MSNHNFKIIGIFYTKQDGKIIWEATPLSTGAWAIITDKESFNRKDVYLDRNKKIPAPKDNSDREKFIPLVNSYIDKYEEKLTKCEENDGYKKISPSYLMEYNLIKSYLKEYKKIYLDHFRSNSVKFIFDDWLNE